MKIVYSPNYYADIGHHVFPMQKYKLVLEKLIENGLILKSCIVEPESIDLSSLLLVHTQKYIDKLKMENLSYEEELILELPYSKELFKAFKYACGGTTLAGRHALEQAVGINVGGGFHHAFSDHGEGFCMLNDIAVCVMVLKKERKIKRSLIFDCDLHQGNGTASIFTKDNDVFTYSIHQEKVYPLFKEKSTLDVNLSNGTSDDEYLSIIDSDILWIIDEFKPDFIVYVAGADPYKDDQLGALELTMNGLMKRDEIVFETAKRFSIPIVVVLGGGYAYKIDDTIQIHYNTIKKALEIFR
ncbi:TPA: histone deacetylase [bacterium]|nr:histone deacetylase [bacterium]